MPAPAGVGHSGTATSVLNSSIDVQHASSEQNRGGSASWTLEACCLYCMGLEMIAKIMSRIPNMAIESHTSNIPEADIGKY